MFEFSFFGVSQFLDTYFQKGKLAFCVEFTIETLMKAAQNAAHVARIKKAQKNLNEGKGIYFTDEELEELVSQTQ